MSVRVHARPGRRARTDVLGYVRTIVAA